MKENISSSINQDNLDYSDSFESGEVFFEMTKNQLIKEVSENSKVSIEEVGKIIETFITIQIDRMKL